jgi:peptidyl-prolyl cis-trans isomerase C
MQTAIQHQTACQSSSCQCADQLSAHVVTINGIQLEPILTNSLADSMADRAYAELLRQHAESLGLLPTHEGRTAPAVTDVMRQTIESMLDREIVTPEPTEEECRRHFEAHKHQFVRGQAAHLRHILFAVTPGVNVQALSQRAEQALLSLMHIDAPVGLFAKLATELSNCPTGATGGDLGWVTPDDCAPELARALFQQTTAWPTGIHPRLVHTRFGLHIIEVLDQKLGIQVPYEQAALAIGVQLKAACRAKALHQFMRVLVGKTHIEGIHLDGTESPLLQ